MAAGSPPAPPTGSLPPAFPPRRRAAGGENPQRRRVILAIGLVLFLCVLALVLRVTTRRASTLLLAALADDVIRIARLSEKEVRPGDVILLQERWGRMRKRVEAHDADLAEVADGRARLARALADRRLTPDEAAALLDRTSRW